MIENVLFSHSGLKITSVNKKVSYFRGLVVLIKQLDK